MNASASIGSEAVFNVFRARDMFVADELRLRSLRALWREADGDVDQLNAAIEAMRAAGQIEVIGDGANSCVRLTSSGFDAMRKAAALPIAQPAAAPAPRPRPAARPAARPAQPPPRRAQPLATSPQGPADPVHLQVLLAVLKHLNVRAGGSVSRQGLATLWSQMKLDYADLVRCVDECLRQELLARDSRDPGRVRLTTVGFARTQAPPADMSEARHRIQASRHVRALKQLGAIRKGVAV